jgi:hypothetical protein
VRSNVDQAVSKFGRLILRDSPGLLEPASNSWFNGFLPNLQLKSAVNLSGCQRLLSSYYACYVLSIILYAESQETRSTHIKPSG